MLSERLIEQHFILINWNSSLFKNVLFKTSILNKGKILEIDVLLKKHKYLLLLLLLL